MSTFNEAIARMKDLYTYGNNDETKRTSTHTLEYHKIGADGKSYGIVKECSKYYIKSAPQDKAMIAEAYSYLGGENNKKHYEYTSYNNALKNFELKLASINEAYNGNVNIENLDKFKSNNILAECSDAMKKEIARQRQIMHNVAMIMNESSEFGVNPNETVKKYNGENPEAPKGNSKNENKKTSANPEFKGTNTHGLKKEATPFEKKVNENCDECGCSSENDWGSNGICKGKDPKNIGWNMDGQEMVSEEYEDWASEGLPSEPGVGEADTDHNNDPFNNSINENDEFELADEDGEEEDEELDGEVNGDEIETDGDEIETDGDEIETDDDEIETDGDEIETDGDEIETDGDEIETDGDEIETDDDEIDLGLNGDDSDTEFEDDSDFEVELDDNDDDVKDIDVENDDEWEDVDFGEEDDEDTLPVDDEYEESIDECGDNMPLYENKKMAMRSIVNSVVNEILNENELHVFGKHPGYRKKPMELPTTGEDHTQWGDDWNDESVHSEEPFGSKIGDGDPFNQLVKAVTNTVMEQLKYNSILNGKKKMK